jgi:broad specificity phosphatase PhoE
MRLLFIRHGQMDFGGDLVLDARTINQWFNAEREAGLSAQGRDEATAAARYLIKHPVDAVYTSHLLRARQTAEVTANRLRLPVHETRDLAELRPGNLPPDGLGYSYLRLLARLPLLGPGWRRRLLGGAMIQLYFTAWMAGRTTGGETRPDLESRIERVFAHLRQTHAPNARVALFAHGYLIFYLSGWLSASSPSRPGVLTRPHIANCAVTELDLGPAGPPRLIRYADAAHVRGSLT